MALDLLVVVAGILGLASLGRAITTTREGWRLVAARPVGPETEPGDLVRASGAVVPEDGELVAPVSGASCVAYVIAQQLSYVAGYQIPLERWRTERTAGEIRPFALDTAVGTVLVDRDSRADDGAVSRATFGGEPPDGLFSDVRLEVDERSREFAAGESPPSAVLDVLGGGPAKPAYPHRYVEWRIEAGDEISIVGKAAAHDDPTTGGRVAIGGDDATFIVSETGHRRTLLAFVARAAAYGGFGVLALGLAAFRLSATLG